ncbi:uncharacterized protein LOC127283684 [Leptopilina boulardi]|uniref:uncharacterized protein LOC127283684 n=1 Tax=Leptopilina boulardi TaxID=63433 RepID=UPI0021F52406|nr:uncharacterized protein LOC127283684 [Leptopilina boulardi]
MKPLDVLPLNVSPLIKLSRWMFLIAGIYHGIVKHREYKIEADKFRKEEEEMKLIRKEQFAREQNLRNQETARELAEALTGLRVEFKKVFSSENNDNSSSENELTSIDKSQIKINTIATESSSHDKSTSTNEFIFKDDSNSINDDQK